MKKILLVFTILLTSLKVTSIYALENNTSYNFTEHIQVLDKLNRTYETGFHIYNEDEFYTNEYDKLLNINFEEYLELISNIEPIDLYNQCLSVINTPTYVDTNIEQLVNRSTLATKTKYFNENLNKMTLKYKYIVAINLIQDINQQQLSAKLELLTILKCQVILEVLKTRIKHML